MCSGLLHEISQLNVEGIKIPAYCKEHAEKGMVDVRSQRCLHDSCARSANFSFKCKAGVCCEQHAKKGMMSVHSPFTRPLPENAEL